MGRPASIDGQCGVRRDDAGTRGDVREVHRVQCRTLWLCRALGDIALACKFFGAAAAPRSAAGAHRDDRQVPWPHPVGLVGSSHRQFHRRRPCRRGRLSERVPLASGDRAPDGPGSASCSAHLRGGRGSHGGPVVASLRTRSGGGSKCVQQDRRRHQDRRAPLESGGNPLQRSDGSRTRVRDLPGYRSDVGSRVSLRQRGSPDRDRLDRRRCTDQPHLLRPLASPRRRSARCG